MTERELDIASRTVYLGGGHSALVDTEDFERISRHKWYRSHWGYAVRFVGRKCIYMHREILGTPEGMDTDHVNRIKLDNRKSNLRACTRSENMRNRSGQIGVGMHKRTGKWRAYLKINGRHIERWGFSTRDEALEARSQLARKHFGAFAP